MTWAEAVSAPVTRVPAPVMVLSAATSVQFGAALAATLFDDLGPAGTSALRVGLAAVFLLLAWRPRVRGVATARARMASRRSDTFCVAHLQTDRAFPSVRSERGTVPFLF